MAKVPEIEVNARKFDQTVRRLERSVRQFDHSVTILGKIFAMQAANMTAPHPVYGEQAFYEVFTESRSSTDTDRQ